MALAFEQQPKESNKAFAAFSVYLSMGPKRSLTKAAIKLGQGAGQLRRWSARYDWGARVLAHGAHFARVEREAAEALARVKGVDWVKRQEKQRNDEWEARCEALELAREAIQRWKKNAKKCGTLEGIARLLDLASKLGRLASGMPTDRTEVTAEVEGKIDVEWEMAIKRVYGQAGPGPNAPAAREAVPAEVVDVEAKALAGGQQGGTDGGA